MKLEMLALASAPLAFGSAANSATIIEQQISPVESGHFDSPFDAAQFDPALGTLTSVEIQFGVQYRADLTGFGSVHATFTSSLADGSDRLFPHSAAPSQRCLADPFTGHCVIPVLTLRYFKAFPDSEVFSGDFSQFIGTGDLPLSFHGTTHIQIGTGSATEVSRLIVTYDYTRAPPPPPVPEPATWTILTLGIGAVGAGLRRRRAMRDVRAMA